MKRLPAIFYSIPAAANTTMSQKDLHELLLNTEGWIFAHGRCWNIESKHIGAGVYRVWLQTSFGSNL